MRFREGMNNLSGAFRLQDYHIFRMVVYLSALLKHRLWYKLDKILFFVEQALADGWAAIFSYRRFALVYGLVAIFGRRRQDKFYTGAWHDFHRKCRA